MHTGILKGDSSEEEGCRRIIEEIDAFIGQCAGKKVSFQVLYNKLLGKDFGTRKEVIPIFIAKEIINLQDTPIIYLQNKEVEISSSIFKQLTKNHRIIIFLLRKVLRRKISKGLELFLSEELRKKQKSKMSALKQHCGKYAEMVQIIGPVYFNIYKNSFLKKMSRAIWKKMLSKECTLFRKVLKGIELKRSSFEKIPRQYVMIIAVMQFLKMLLYR